MGEKHFADVSKKDTISRQAAIDAVEKAVTKEAARWSIEELPSTQPEQPEIIHCKDCIYYRQEIDMCDEPCSTAHNVVHEDDYCSRAKKENG